MNELRIKFCYVKKHQGATTNGHCMYMSMCMYMYMYSVLHTCMYMYMYSVLHTCMYMYMYYACRCTVHVYSMHIDPYMCACAPDKNYATKPFRRALDEG